jgi:hypothetical protein
MPVRHVMTEHDMAGEGTDGLSDEQDDVQYTLLEVAKLLDMSERNVYRLLKIEGIRPLGKSPTKPRVNMYSGRTIDFLVSEHKAAQAPPRKNDGQRQPTTDMLDGQGPPMSDALVPVMNWPDMAEMMARLDRYHQESLGYAEKLGTVTAERDAALTRVEEVSGRLGAMSAEGDAMLVRLEEVVAAQAALDAAMQGRVEGLVILQAERDRLKARITELEGQEPAEPPVRRKRFWIF